MSACFVYVGSADAGQAKIKNSPGFGKVVVDRTRQGILIFRVGDDGHSLLPVGMLELPFHVGWLARHPMNGFLYAVGGGHLHAVAVAADGSLSLFSSAGTVGEACYLELSQDGRWALVASYSDSTTAVLPIRPDGGVGDATDSKHHSVSLNPALADRQEKCHPHQIVLDPTGRWALSCDLGADCIWVFAFDSEHGALVGASSSHRHLKLPEGAGPRHLHFHPNGRWVYVLCELDGNMVVCDWSATKGQLSLKQTLYILPEGVACSRAPHSGNAHVLVADDGCAVYATGRTANEVIVFHIEEATGQLTKVQTVSTGGICPRNFHLHYPTAAEARVKMPRTGKPCRMVRLRVANQDSQNIATFLIQRDGTLVTPPDIQRLDGVCPQVIIGPITPSPLQEVQRVRVLVLNGKGLDTRGQTEQSRSHFNSTATFSDYSAFIQSCFLELGVDGEHFQTNDLDAFVAKAKHFTGDAIVTNPGFFSWEASLGPVVEEIQARGVPVIEVHYGNYQKKKHVGSISKVAQCVLLGGKLQGYRKAIELAVGTKSEDWLKFDL